MRQKSRLARIYDTKRGMVAVVEIVEQRGFVDSLLDRPPSREIKVVDGSLTEVETNKISVTLRVSEYGFVVACEHCAPGREPVTVPLTVPYSLERGCPFDEPLPPITEEK